MTQSRMILFGASTMAGFWDDRGGWYSRLREDLTPYSKANRDDEFQMYNCSVSGDTSEDLRKRIRTELQARDEDSKSIITLISIGGNDTLLYLGKGENKVEKDRFRDNLEFILDVAEEFSYEIVFISGTPNNWDMTEPLEWDDSKAYRKEDMEEYDRIKKDICRDRGIRYIDLHRELGEEWEEKLFDGVHPDSEGHREIKRIMKRKLKEFDIIPESV